MRNLKKCDSCGNDRVIWKNERGNRYCKACWAYLNKDNVRQAKQSKPLKRTPLKRSTTPIRKRSKKRASQENVYSRLRKEFLLSSHTCQAKLPNCTHTSTDVHHMRGRVGDLLTDTTHWLSVCRSCHNWIELNPKEAKKLGFSKDRLKND
jgi:hypothetical protein